MVRTDKRRALPASRWICPLFTLVLVGSTLASADSRPPEVGAPSGPQLEATRDLLYGPGLSTDESAYVDSWAPRDSAWWLDGQRAVDAFETRERLLGQLSNAETTPQHLARGLETLGLELEAPIGELPGFVDIPFALRPDLFPLAELFDRWALRTLHPVWATSETEAYPSPSALLQLSSIELGGLLRTSQSWFARQYEGSDGIDIGSIGFGLGQAPSSSPMARDFTNQFLKPLVAHYWPSHRYTEAAVHATQNASMERFVRRLETFEGGDIRRHVAGDLMAQSHEEFADLQARTTSFLDALDPLLRDRFLTYLTREWASGLVVRHYVTSAEDLTRYYEALHLAATGTAQSYAGMPLVREDEPTIPTELSFVRGFSNLALEWNLAFDWEERQRLTIDPSIEDETLQVTQEGQFLVTTRPSANLDAPLGLLSFVATIQYQTPMPLDVGGSVDQGLELVGKVEISKGNPWPSALEPNATLDLGCRQDHRQYMAESRRARCSLVAAGEAAFSVNRRGAHALRMDVTAETMIGGLIGLTLQVGTDWQVSFTSGVGGDAIPVKIESTTQVGGNAGRSFELRINRSLWERQVKRTYNVTVNVDAEEDCSGSTNGGGGGEKSSGSCEEPGLLSVPCEDENCDLIYIIDCQVVASWLGDGWWDSDGQYHQITYHHMQCELIQMVDPISGERWGDWVPWWRSLKSCHDADGWQTCAGADGPLPVDPSNLGLTECVPSRPDQPVYCDRPEGTLDPTGQAPDLQVNDLRLLGLGSALPDDPFRAELTVRNHGQGPAENSIARVTYTNGSNQSAVQEIWLGTLTGLAERRFVLRSDENIAVPLALAAGLNQVTVELDVYGAVGEGDELNNSANTSTSLSVHSISQVDARITDVHFDQTHPSTGSALSFSYTLQNSGLTEISEAVVRTRIFAPGQPMVEQIDFFNFLFPGNTFTGGGTVATTHPGEAQIEVRVDPQGLLQEGDVTNNQGLAVITIYDSAESCLPCTTGAPLDTVGSLLCLADPDTGMPADGSVWQCQGVRADGTSCVASGNHPNGWGYQGPRCPDPATLPAGLHPDACGIADICPGTGP